MIKIVTNDVDTDDNIIGHLSGYLVALHRPAEAPGQLGDHLGDFFLTGTTSEPDGWLRLVAHPAVEDPSSYCWGWVKDPEAEPQTFDFDDVVIEIY